MFYVTAKRDIVKYGCSLYFTAAECESPTVVGMCVSEGCRKKRRSLDNNYFIVVVVVCLFGLSWGRSPGKIRPEQYLRPQK
jgi:hypothetical protein